MIIFIGILFVSGVIFLIRYCMSLIFNEKPSFNQITIVDKLSLCSESVQRLTGDFKPVFGFDCEWVTEKKSRRPVALVQIANLKGEITLFRLCKLGFVPRELKIFLEDPKLYKVGVACVDDAKYLRQDYSIECSGLLDVRHLAKLAKEEPHGLARLSQKHLNHKMNKDWKISCSDWEANTLTMKQINYAADDALRSLQLCKHFISRLSCENSDSSLKFKENWNMDDFENICEKFINVRFSYKPPLTVKSDIVNLLSEEQKIGLKTKNIKRKYTSCISNQQVYENCYMQTADGEILCTCDRKKSEWYVEKNLAKVICEDPFTIQLNFEPAGRSVGSVGKFYQLPRKKICVVCGSDDKSYIKKNVIPKEYRRLFPPVMKDHSCHDVLLMCTDCHQISNIRDQTMRNHLAKDCNAPITITGQPKVIEDPQLKKIKSAARALLVASSKHEIPEKRLCELKQNILKFFPDEDRISDELLRTACDLDYRSENNLYESHGQIVVDHFIKSSNGLLELEKIWRQHFLNSMKPEHLPELWSVDHTKSRLEIKINEGRVNEEDLQIAGLTLNNFKIS